MSAAEFRDHLDDWLRGEWGERRADARAASICQTFANMSGKTLKQGNYAKLGDFLLKFDNDDEEKTINDSSSFLKEFGNLGG